MTSKITKALFIGSYPNPVNPYVNIFFRELICNIADLGVECYVISKVSISKYNKRIAQIPRYREDLTNKGNVVHVYYPRYISFSAKKIGSFNTYEFTKKYGEKVVIKEFKRLGIEFDFIYGHFFLDGGIVSSKIGKKYGIPAFVAYGECDYRSEISNKHELTNDDIDGLKGIIAVSSKNLNDMRTMTLTKNINTVLSVNSVDHKIFKKLDKKECRCKLGMPENDFIVGFVGYFIERKGSKRLVEACKNLEGVHLAFAGKGGEKPSGENVIFCESLNHEDVATFLNAIDVFALPTLNEGCSNAIVEAMSCGCAIVSSNLPFNRDVLNDNNSILIDPMDIMDIRKAVIELRDNAQLRYRISTNAFEDSKKLSIENRAVTILDFIERIIHKEQEK